MLVILILGATLIFAGLYFLLLAFLARNPANLSTAVGSLAKASGYKNVRGAHGNWIIKDQTDYTYAYMVNGRTYHRKGRMNRHKRRLPQKVTIVYLTRFPRHSGIEAFTAQVEFLLGLFMLFQGTVLTVICLLICAPTLG